MLIQENLPTPGAIVRIEHFRPYDYDPTTGLFLYHPVDEQEVHNILTNTGRVQLHDFMYGTTPRANGFNYIGLSNDGAAPNATDATLTSELTGNGLDRAQGTVTPPVGAGNQTTISHTFVYLGGGSQAIQKAALFDVAGPPPAGIMNHEILFTTRTLFQNDTLVCTFTCTAG